MSEFDWDVRSPRAVAPDAALKKADVPVECTAEHARNSPTMYGCAIVCSNDDDIGTAGPIRMVWVSRRAAAARGRGVCEGWYVCAPIGDYFALHLTNVHPAARQRLKGEQLRPGTFAAAFVKVDGACAVGKRALLVGAHQEMVIKGFTEKAVFKEGAANGRLELRRFKFTKAALDEQGAVVSGASQVLIDVVLGQTRKAKYDAQVRDGLVGAVEKSSEKQAVKGGASIRVQRNGSRLSEPLRRANFRLNASVIQTTINVYIRERSWLESRHIICHRGKAWKPSICPTPVDLTLIDDNDDRANGAAS